MYNWQCKIKVRRRRRHLNRGEAAFRNYQLSIIHCQLRFFYKLAISVIIQRGDRFYFFNKFLKYSETFSIYSLTTVLNGEEPIIRWGFGLHTRKYKIHREKEWLGNRAAGLSKAPAHHKTFSDMQPGRRRSSRRWGTPVPCLENAQKANLRPGGWNRAA